MRNPLNTSPGKGDAPRNCHNPKFRENYENISWGMKFGEFINKSYSKHLENKVKIFKNKKKK